MTIYTGRPPISFATTNYDALIGYNSLIPYDGVITYPTAYAVRSTITTTSIGRQPIQSTTYILTETNEIILTESGQEIVFEYVEGTIYTGRVIPT